MTTKHLILALLLIALLSVIFLEAFDVIGGCYPTWHVTLRGCKYKKHSKALHACITRTLDMQAPADQASMIALRIAHGRWPRRHWEVVSIVPVP